MTHFLMLGLMTLAFQMLKFRVVIFTVKNSSYTAIKK